MLHQGEVIKFCGSFESLVGETWTTITDLSPYTIVALVSNPTTTKKYIFSTSADPESPYVITTSVETKGEKQVGIYTFSISEEDSALLKGACRLEIALKDEDGETIIADNSGEFIVKESALGRALAAENEEASGDE